MPTTQRILIFFNGVGVSIIGALMVYRRVPPYTNYLGQNFFPVTFIAIGFVIAIVAFLPPGRWMYRHITTKGKNKQSRQPWKLKI
jgi:hypothetical protein